MIPIMLRPSHVLAAVITASLIGLTACHPPAGEQGAKVSHEFPAGSPEFLASFEAATAAAKSSGNPALLVFSAAWCPPCQAMKKGVYPSDEVKPYHDKFIWAYLDIDDPANNAAANRFSVNGIPHIQILSADGKALDKKIGGTTPDDFAKFLHDALELAKR